MHQVDNDTTRAPFLMAGGDSRWTPETERAPVLLGTRLHFVPKTVDGRPIEAPQRTKSGGRGRPAKAQEAYWVSRDLKVDPKHVGESRRGANVPGSPSKGALLTQTK